MKSILVIGLGRFGRNVIKKLVELHHEVMAVDCSEDRVQDVMDYATNALVGDATEVRFLQELGVDNYDLCIVAIGDDFQASLETVSMLKEMGAKMIVARACSLRHRKFLLKLGADEVVYPEEQLASWTAVRYSGNHLLDYMELDDNYGIFELEMPDDWVGKTPAQLNIRTKYHVNVMGVREEGVLRMDIGPDRVFRLGSSVLLLGKPEDVQKYFKE